MQMRNRAFAGLASAFLSCGTPAAARSINDPVRPFPHGLVMKVELKVAPSCSFAIGSDEGVLIRCSTVRPMILTLLSDVDPAFAETLATGPASETRLRPPQLSSGRARRLNVDF